LAISPPSLPETPSATTTSAWASSTRSVPQQSSLCSRSVPTSVSAATSNNAGCCSTSIVTFRRNPDEAGLPMRELNVGERLDQYALTELLARSGMASIFKADDTVSGGAVALKVPHPQLESDVVFFQRFKREEDLGLR